MLHVNNQQKNSATALIRQACANIDEGHCLLLCDYDFEICPQLITNSLLCRYFRNAVLPSDKLLYSQIMNADVIKRCELCKKPFQAGSNRAKYCTECAKKARKKQTRESMRKIRVKV